MKNVLLGIYLTLLLLGNGWAENAHDVVVNELSRTNLSWDRNELPNYPTGKPEITILKIIIPAGVQLPMHNHPVINAGVLLSGELTVVTEDNKKLYLKAGEPIVEVVNKWHYGKNEGNQPVEIIVFYAGTQGKPITVREKIPAHIQSFYYPN